MSNDDKKYLATVKEGDTVVRVQGSGWSRSEFIEKVKRVTKTRIVIELCDKRFVRATGREEGSRWGDFLIEPTAEVMQRIDEENRNRAACESIRRVLDGKFRWADLELPQKERLAELLNELFPAEQP